jgi:hypothetical protein
MAAAHVTDVLPRRVRCAIALRVEEQTCEVWSEGARASIGFAAQFPSPRSERVSPGHLLAVATAPDGRDVAVWRWYAAVVLDHDEAGRVRLWEPGHGEVIAEARTSYRPQQPGSRVYASAGLPGAEWWVRLKSRCRPTTPRSNWTPSVRCTPTTGSGRPRLAPASRATARNQRWRR